MSPSLSKKFAIDAANIKPLAPERGHCFASDKITVDGRPVGFMYREDVDDESDSGWRFLAGDESDDYLDDPDNFAIYDVNTIANYDRAIIQHLDAPVGCAFSRDSSGNLVRD